MIKLHDLARKPLEGNEMSDIFIDMSRKKNEPEPKPDHHDDKPKRKRVPISFPKSWMAIINALAHKKRRPAMWVVIELIKAEAEKEGISQFPSAPWEDGYTEASELD